MGMGMGIPAGFLWVFLWVWVWVTRSGPAQKPIPVTMGMGMGTQLISTVCKTKNITNYPKLKIFIVDWKFRKSQKMPKLFVVLQSKFSSAKPTGTCLQVWVWVNPGSIYVDPCKNLYPLGGYRYIQKYPGVTCAHQP